MHQLFTSPLFTAIAAVCLFYPANAANPIVREVKKVVAKVRGRTWRQPKTQKKLIEMQKRVNLMLPALKGENEENVAAGMKKMGLRSVIIVREQSPLNLFKEKLEDIFINAYILEVPDEVKDPTEKINKKWPMLMKDKTLVIDFDLDRLKAIHRDFVIWQSQPKFHVKDLTKPEIPEEEEAAMEPAAEEVAKEKTGIRAKMSKKWDSAKKKMGRGVERVRSIGKKKRGTEEFEGAPEVIVGAEMPTGGGAEEFEGEAAPEVSERFWGVTTAAGPPEVEKAATGEGEKTGWRAKMGEKWDAAKTFLGKGVERVKSIGKKKPGAGETEVTAPAEDIEMQESTL